MEDKPLKKEKPNLFLIKNKEDADFNQYWYSKASIEFIVNEV